jgi:peptidoglycan/LPS O-acetylase OafA/YrhL
MHRRPEIQALRGIAVTLVVINHFWTRALPGGFAGVDVFYAVSGFLITSQLVRELDDGRRISLAGFWARRARRILPAAFAVLICCAVATLAIVPETSWPRFLSEIRASAGFVENWQLAASAVDYFKATDPATPVQHYWSLSVEEQFYLVWPLLLSAVALVASRARRRRAAASAIGVLVAASLGYSAWRTVADPSAAYFETTTRAWELGAGGLLALAPASAARWPAWRASASWLGLAAIALAAALYSSSTPFPGIAAALPVGGALAVIWAGAPAPGWAPTPLLCWRPLRALGEISYSVYLWHWPLLVLAPFATGRPVDTTTTLIVLMLTLLASWLSKRFIEDPFRSGRVLRVRRAPWAFGYAGVATLIVLALTASGTFHLEQDVRAAERHTERVLASHPACFAASARDSEHPCENPALRLTVVPTPLEAHKQPNFPCPLLQLKGLLYVCGFGAPARGAATTIALIGDSHASHWRAALDVVARARHWTGVSLSHTGCPFSKATKNLPEPRRSQCVEWNRQVLRWLHRHPEVSTVFVSEISGGAGVIAPGRDQLAAQRAGYVAAWKALPASVKHVVVLRDTPKALGDTDTCVTRAIAHHAPAGTACKLPRHSALTQDSAAVAATRLNAPNVRVVDMTSFFCDRGYCYPVIGGALVYKDQNHMTETFSRSLGPFLQRELQGL